MSSAESASTAATLDEQVVVARKWSAAHVAPLWENRAAHRADDDGPERAHIWRWSDMQAVIDAAIGVKSMAAIERRVLSLVSPHTPAVGGATGTTTNLNAGLQILMPGEKARPHRHSMNALRFVLAGKGATTVVDGKACPMDEGDLVTTPGWCWHEHSYDGDGPIVWLDVLDASLHRYLGTDAFQPGPANDVPSWPSDAAFASAGLVPDTAAPAFSPMFRYPWAAASAAVSAAPVGRDGARRIRYVNPQTGGPVMSLLDCWLVEVPPATSTVAFRTSANAVCAVVDGEGESEIGKQRFTWGPRDVFSLPHGNWIRHTAGDKPARLFFVSDREVLRRLDLLQEEYSSAS
ncbi:MAG: cupin domain-containing protein [Hyphomicrobiaceae bacterium]